MYEIAKSLMYISYASVLLPLFFFFRRKQNFSKKVITLLGVLLFVSALSDIISYITLKSGYATNAQITNVYVVIEFLLISILYAFLLKKKKIILIVILFFMFFFIVDSIFIESFNEFQSLVNSFESVIMIIFSIQFFFKLLKEMPMITVSILKYYPFWINTAVFYYFGASFLIFFTITYIFKTQSVNFSVIIWSFHNLNNIIKNILFAVAIYFAGRYPNPINPNAIMSDDIDLDNIKL